MSTQLKDQIFYTQSSGYEEVEFYRIIRSTTNTCEVSRLRKVIIFQSEDIQYVEPDIESDGLRFRCKVLSSFHIKFKTGELGLPWDGKPVKQIALIFVPVF